MLFLLSLPFMTTTVFIIKVSKGGKWGEKPSEQTRCVACLHQS